MPTKPDYQLHLAIMLMILISMGVMNLVLSSAPTCRGLQGYARLDVNTLSQTVAAYRIDTDEWPSRLQDLVVCPTQLANSGKWNGPYFIRGLPTDPWGNAYFYQAEADGYLVGSAGLDGIKDTSDDIVDRRKLPLDDW